MTTDGFSSERGHTERDFLAGGGEMGALMRSLDWSKTPLGPVSGWSQALRTTVGLLLRNRFPIMLWWGPQFIQLYNDTYRPIPGAKHPRSMGQPASECWSEIWHIIGPMVEAPFSGQPATTSDDLLLLMNRRGFLEETHFMVAYSPVPDETIQPTGIGGVIATVAETSKQVYGERQLRTLRELGMRAAEAKTAEQACNEAVATLEGNRWDVPFALFYLADVNEKQLRLVASCGFDKEQGPANPSIIDFDADSESATWPLANVVRNRKTGVFEDIGSRFGTLPAGRWAEPPHTAIALPLAAPNQPHAYGVLIAGVNPHRVLDEDYRSFFELAADQVTTAIRNARAYQEERQRAEALAEIDRAKTLFFSNVSHEFRTPLTLMLGPVEDALADAEHALPQPQRERLELAHRNSLRLLRLVNTMLDFSRIEAGRIEAVYEPTDLAEFSTALSSVFRSAIERAGLELTVDCPPLPEPIYIDRDMWEKVVFNLLSNAFKFTFSGEIVVQLRQVKGRAELTVSDTGTGIPPEELPHIFERFHRIRNARGRTHEGSGIGLALVQELVRFHGGTVSVESVYGKGSAFTVSVPLGTNHLPSDRIEATRTLASTATGGYAYVEEALRWLPETEPPASEEPAPVVIQNGSREESRLRNARVMLVDDNADMRDYLRRILSEQYEVEAVADGQTALNAISRRQPDLLVADIMMPGIDGLELVRRIRANPETASLPIILLSARAGEEAKVEGLEVGADDYLVKPFSTSELLARVRTYLERVEEERARLNREREIRQALQSILDSLTEGVIAVNNALEIRQANAYAARLLQQDVETLVGQPVTGVLEFIVEHRENGFDLAGVLQGCLARDEAFQTEETWLALPGGGRIPVSLVVSRDQGRGDGAILAFRDISRRKEIDELRDSIVSMVSHELRTPIHHVRGYASSLLQPDVEWDEDTRLDFIRSINQEADRLGRLVENILNMSRLGTGGQSALNLAPARPEELVQRSLEEASFRIQEHALSVDVPEGLLPVMADSERIRLVLANLLENAAKYSPAGSRIRVSARPGEGEVIFSIEDEGAGIPDEERERIFERFTRLQRAGGSQVPGTGLGLAICRMVVTSHKGRIWVDSRPGGGSIFSFAIPEVNA